ISSPLSSSFRTSPAIAADCTNVTVHDDRSRTAGQSGYDAAVTPHAPAPPRRLGFVDGLVAPWRGLGFLMSTPGVWGLAAVPALVLLALAGGGSVLGIWAVEAWAAPR